MTVVHVLFSCPPHLEAIFVFQLTVQCGGRWQLYNYFIEVFCFFFLYDEGVPRSLFSLRFVTLTSRNRIRSVVLNAVTGAHYQP